MIWFGETPYHLHEIETALLSVTHFIAIGTSGQVWPAAGMLHAARQLGARTWVQALEPPANQTTEDDYVEGRAADGPAAQGLDQIVGDDVPAPGHVDQPCVRLHGGEKLGRKFGQQRPG